MRNCLFFPQVPSICNLDYPQVVLSSVFALLSIILAKNATAAAVISHLNAVLGFALAALNFYVIAIMIQKKNESHYPGEKIFGRLGQGLASTLGACASLACSTAALLVVHEATEFKARQRQIARIKASMHHGRRNRSSLRTQQSARHHAATTTSAHHH